MIGRILSENLLINIIFMWKKIRLVMDNFNTHTKASLYEAFAPPEAKRIADKLNFFRIRTHFLGESKLEV